MAPVERVDHDEIEQQLKDVIQDLYQVMVQVSTYDSMGRSSKEVLSNETKTLSRSLQTLHTSASPPNVLPSVPPELLEYVENGRNPDIYTREFVELVRRGNQVMRGKMHAFADFRDVLAKNMSKANPELREDIVRVLEATGGSKAALDGAVTLAADRNGATAATAATGGHTAANAGGEVTTNATATATAPSPVPGSSTASTSQNGIVPGAQSSTQGS